MVKKDSNVGYRQMKVDLDAYRLMKDKQVSLKKEGRHVSMGDTIRELFREKETTKDFWFWKCNKCGTVLKSTTHKRIPVEPVECFEADGGCGRVSSFVNITEDVLRERLKAQRVELHKETPKMRKVEDE